MHEPDLHFARPRRARLETLWQNPEASDRLLARALAPAELLFRAAAALRSLRYDVDRASAVRVAVPVISVGNLTVGGTGKTPFARWLMGELLARGHAAALLHGGYGSDEPELHHAWHPEALVIANPDRVAAARAAVTQGATVIVLDDGMQHRRLARDLEIVLVAAEQWRAKPRLLPRGPYREPPAALGRADVVVVTRRVATRHDADRTAREVRQFTRASQAQAALEPTGWTRNGVATGPPPERAVVVTGVADPRAVVTLAQRGGASIDEALAFPDHHAFDAVDVERITRFAGSREVVCTAKDWVKLRHHGRLPAPWVVELGMTIESGGPEIARALERVLA